MALILRCSVVVLAICLSVAPAQSRGHGGHSYSHSSRSYSTRSYHSHSYRSPSNSRHSYHTGSGVSPHRSYSPPSYHAPRTYSYESVQRDSHGRIKRSGAAKDSFKRQHPCPSTGKSSGACPGYVVDHVKALRCGGADAPSNMQWQTTAAAKAKDKTERYCR